MLQANETSWVILAGGKATRMDGCDKGLIQLNDKPLIEHVLQRLQPQTTNISININRNIDTYRQYAPIITDEIAGFPGPLGGVHASLMQAQTDWVGFVPCDSPLISTDLVAKFCAAASIEDDILVAHDGEYQQPVFALYHRRVLPKLTQFLERGDRKIMLFFKECQTQNVDFSQQTDCFFNLNTPQELAQFGQIK